MAQLAGDSKGLSKKPKSKDGSSTVSHLKSVAKPDAAAFGEKNDAANRAIEELRKMIVDLQKRISSMSEGKEEYNRKKLEMREKLDELNEKVVAVESQRLVLVEKIDSKQRESREMRVNVSSLKKSLGFCSEDDIERRIQEIEKSMMISTLPLKEEKKLMQQISQLKANKPLVGRYATLETNANAFEDNSIVPLKKRLDLLRVELNELRSLKREEMERYKNFVAERSQTTAPVRELLGERAMLERRLEEQIAKRVALVDEFNSETKKHLEYQSQVTSMRNEKFEEDRKKRATEQERLYLERQLEAEKPLPFNGQVLLLQQTINYLLKLADSDQKPTQEGIPSNLPTASASSVPEPAKIEGVEFLPKKEREESYYSALKGKKSANRKHGNKKEKQKVLKHDLRTIAIFEECGVDAPVIASDLQSCLQQLQSKHSELKKQQEGMIEENKERRKKIMAKMAALDGMSTAYAASEDEFLEKKEDECVAEVALA